MIFVMLTNCPPEGLSDYERRLAVYARDTTDILYADLDSEVGDINPAIAYHTVEALTLAGLNLVASAHGSSSNTIGQLARLLAHERYDETHIGPPHSWEKIQNDKPGKCRTLTTGVGLWVPNHTITL